MTIDNADNGFIIYTADGTKIAKTIDEAIKIIRHEIEEWD